MERYKEYLAAKILSDGEAVDFRLLSRALKVHVNLAKQMLFEFHRIQNAKKPGSVHATYCVSGAKSNASRSPPQTNGNHKGDGGNTVMQSSPPVSSVPDQGSDIEDEVERVPVTTISLVQEEDFEKAKAEFQLITGMYLHSLQPSRLENVHTLSDCTRQLQEDFGNEDPLQAWKQYGVIQNPHVKRRTRKRPAGLPAPAPASSKAAPKAGAQSQPRPSETTAGVGIKEEGVVREQAGAHAAPVSDLSSKKPEPPTVRREKSNLFAAFNKAKEKERPRKPKEEDPSQDAPMDDAEDEEDTGDLVPLDSADADEAHRKARAERAQKLKEMMDEDDEDMADAPIAEEEPVEDEEQAAPIDIPPSPDADQREMNVQVDGGRRRGRRRVMKKKVSKDAEGYLVTKEEPAWESFSEDEPSPAAKRAKLPSASAPAASKGKAGAAKKGQGNLMSFFGKK